MSSSMAGAVSKPLFFRDALLPYFNWKATNEGHEVPLVINISNKAASNGWQLSTPCTATGTNTIRKLRGWYSSCMFFSERPDFSLYLSCTGTPLSVNTYLSYTGTPLSANTADLRYTGTPLSVNTVISESVSGWQLSTPCTATGTNTIRNMRGWYPSCMFFSKRPDFSLNLSCTGTPLSVNTYLSYTGTPLSANTADLRYTGTPLSVNTVISGYWMGPDDKEECGYVEALVQRIN